MADGLRVKGESQTVCLAVKWVGLASSVLVSTVSGENAACLDRAECG